MRLLLDTHTLLWIGSGGERLSAAARKTLQDPLNEAFVSLVSIWEIAIKNAKGKLVIEADYVLQSLPDFGYQLLSIELEHVLATRHLDRFHGDPFDRLLIAQAEVEGLTIVTHDDAFRPYGVPIILT